MNATQALTQARKRWGSKAAVSDNKRPSSEASRQEAQKQYKPLRNLPPSKKKELRPDWRDLQSAMFYYRYQVGKVDGIAGFMGFWVMGSGDTWDEAFAKADKT